jgi:hypothetical protein
LDKEKINLKKWQIISLKFAAFGIEQPAYENMLFALYEHVRHVSYCTGLPASAHGLRS